MQDEWRSAMTTTGELCVMMTRDTRTPLLCAGSSDTVQSVSANQLLGLSGPLFRTSIESGLLNDSNHCMTMPLFHSFQVELRDVMHSLVLEVVRSGWTKFAVRVMRMNFLAVRQMP